VEAGNADFGVVAVENSTEGTVTNTLDRFIGSPLHICGEVELRIPSLPDGTDGITPGHRTDLRPRPGAGAMPQLLEEHLPGVERVAVSSNAEGARRARDEKGTAAIAATRRRKSMNCACW